MLQGFAVVLYYHDTWLLCYYCAGVEGTASLSIGIISRYWNVDKYYKYVLGVASMTVAMYTVAKLVVRVPALYIEHICIIHA